MKNWKKRIVGLALSAVLLTGSTISVLAEEAEPQNEDIVVLEEAEPQGENVPVLENSWRYANGVPIEQEEPDEGIMPLDVMYTTLRGIDVSEHNGKIDWEKVKASGIDYAILRCGYGKDRTFQDDKYWERNVAECERLGIPYGVYIYSYATTIEEAESEADHVLRLIRGRKFAYPVYLDMEDNSTLTADHVAIASVFASKVEAAGYEVGIYANLYWWNTYLTDPIFSVWHRWVAQYNLTCDYTGEYEMWQYTSKGSVNGIQGNVDMNYVIEREEDDGEFVAPTRFSDVRRGAWFYDAVRYVADEGIMTGMTDEIFGPAENLARAQLVTILYRHAGQPEMTFEERFPDIAEDQFYTDAVMWASSRDVQVATGYTDTGKFGPANSITREELVTMLYRYAKYQKMDVSQKGSLDSFPDAQSVSTYAREAMQWAVAKGVITGDNGRLNPQGTANRAECAAIIMRFMTNK